jgi:hypothetical protein
MSIQARALGLAVALFTALLLVQSATADPKKKGLNQQAGEELIASGLTKYLGEYSPIGSEDVGDGWTKHTFDPDGGDGPICIAGTPYSVFTRDGNSDKLLILLQGGGACWQDFYFCNILAEQQEPPPPPVGIWDFDSKDNPFRNYNVVYMPYCDGSTFGGDNDVVDANFPFGPVRFHRGLRNLSAGMDVARTTYPSVSKLTVAGSSAGGVGAAAFAPFLARFQYGNNTKLTVFNDAGPIAVNLLDVGAVAARAADWQFGQFYPQSCVDCDPFGQQTEIVLWRLENDSTIREAFYETDGDATNRFFTSILTQEMYRALILSEHQDRLNAAFPDRYKLFIVSGDDSHTALQSPLLNLQDANGVPLDEWTRDFISPNPFWINIVEDFIPLP